MSDGFQVSLPAVDELSARVAIGASDIRGALGRMRLNACIDTGDPALTGALDGFSQFWTSAVEEGAQAVDGTAAAMSAAAVAYGQVDATVMVDPSISGAFVDAAMSGNEGTMALLIGPLLPGSNVPVAGSSAPPLMPGFPPYPTEGGGG